MLQQVVGSFLYYARAVDPTMLLELGDIAAAQSRGTLHTMAALHHLLNYAHTHPVATIRYRASDMVLHTHSDASYLSAPNSRSRAGGFLFLGSKQAPSPLNGPLHCEVKIIRNVMASSAESEIGALFINTRAIIPLHTTLHELKHPQPPSPIQTDNVVAHGFATKTIKQRRSKTIAMNFYWIQDQQQLGNVHIFWRPKELNMGDYFTKHHPPIMHRKIRPILLLEHNSPKLPLSHHLPHAERVC